jgi:hypothetical protein
MIGSIEHHPYLTFAPFLIFRFLAPRQHILVGEERKGTSYLSSSERALLAMYLCM